MSDQIMNERARIPKSTLPSHQNFTLISFLSEWVARDRQTAS